MADNAFEWAAERGLTRKNPVHGEEEAKLVLIDGFAFTEEDGEAFHKEGKMTVEAP